MLQFTPPPVTIRQTKSRAAAPAAAADVGAASAASAAFATLNTGCAAAVTAVGQCSWALAGDSGSCNYDCGFKYQDWNWGPVDYTSYATAWLPPAIAGENASGAYSAAFQPTSAWVSGGLSAANGSITSDGSTIQQIDTAIVQAGGSPTPQQSAALAAAFSDAGSALQNNLNQANSALQTLAAFQSQKQSAIGTLAASAQALHTALNNAGTTSENNLIGQIACGVGDVQNSFNGKFFGPLNANFTALQGPFTTVDTDLQAALAATGEVTGAFLIVQSDSALVSNALADAQALPPASPVRALKLSLMLQNWNNLTAYAAAQLVA